MSLKELKLGDAFRMNDNLCRKIPDLISRIYKITEVRELTITIRYPSLDKNDYHYVEYNREVAESYFENGDWILIN